MGECPLDYPATVFGVWGRLPMLEASPKGSSFETFIAFYIWLREWLLLPLLGVLIAI